MPFKVADPRTASSRLRHTRYDTTISGSALFRFRNNKSKSASQISNCTNPFPFFRPFTPSRGCAVAGHGAVATGECRESGQPIAAAAA
jgi:hypothetical protein